MTKQPVCLIGKPYSQEITLAACPLPPPLAVVTDFIWPNQMTVHTSTSSELHKISKQHRKQALDFQSLAFPLFLPIIV